MKNRIETMPEALQPECFLQAEGFKPAEIDHRMLLQYGARCVNQRKIYEWVGRFKAETSVQVDER